MITSGEPGFQGRIGRTLEESEPWWPDPVKPPERHPNVVVVLLDDTGFAQLGCYGSDIETRHIDRLADEGLRYTNFHVTPVCSPTRASLLTGRNHHTVGMRQVANFDTGFPNMRGYVSNHASTMAEVLRERGYATFAVGKWHLCPMAQASAAGPMDQWPLGRGFDRFYGFLDGETDQFHPELVHDNHRVDPPGRPEDGYHLSEDLVDRAIEFVHDSKSLRPDRPFFMWLAFGATHAPHQAPPAYLQRYRGRFDHGWDVARERCFARQQALGLLPEGTVLAPRNPGVEAWEELTPAGRAFAARLQEAFAAFLTHTDDQIGRFVAALEAIGELDDTVVVVVSDNGASQEGGPHGVMHEMKYFNFILESPEEAVDHLDDIGGPRSHTNYPWGWAQAGNTPFRWYKQNTHEGGVRVPFVVRYPGAIPSAGPAARVRHQFHHASDLAPTVYDLLSVEPPARLGGLDQMPVTGVPMTYTFTAPRSESRKQVQYFEMTGHRAIWAEGWKAVTRHEKGDDYDSERWELYHLADDPSECHDLADERPEKVAEMVALWWREAETHGVLPLDDRTIELFGARFAPGTVHAPQRTYRYHPPLAPITPQAGPALGGRSWTMSALIDRPAGGEGVLYASGSVNSGISLFVQGDRLVFDYNFFGDHNVVESEIEVPVGSATLGVRFDRHGETATVTLTVDGAPAGTMELARIMRMMSSSSASVGYDFGSAVSDRYRSPYRFTGRFHRLDVDVDPSGRHRAELAEAGMAAEMSRQ